MLCVAFNQQEQPESRLTIVPSRTADAGKVEADRDAVSAGLAF